MKLILGSLALASSVLAAGRTSAPSGCITVGKSGEKYTTIQAAVNALPGASTGKCIFIQPGTYTEQVLVDASKGAGITFYGYTDDTSGHAGNKVTITSSKSQKDGLTNDETATLRVKAADFKMYNVNVNNGHGAGSQAVALSAYADSGYYGCAFTGFQDTVLTQSGRQLYAKCLIQGATDFVFGQQSFAWFEKSDIRVLSASQGYITANGASKSGASEYVFNNCNVAAASGNSVANGAYYLGRPWAAYAQVVFQKTSLSAVVNPAGWSVWKQGDERTGGVIFGEVGNTGAGASGSRAKFSKQLGAAVEMAAILGSGYEKKGYYDAAYM
ncbi:putative pectinesterase precursor [Apiospora rasikravindrae]|uniref:Pectinesterase n=1 Tax=Apiospora rasikravindrae TaxID=990691 RepID=A0ABR1TDU7_9PEZI